MAILAQRISNKIYRSIQACQSSPLSTRTMDGATHMKIKRVGQSSPEHASTLMTAQ